MSLEKPEGNKTPESERPEWLSMYDVSGHEPVTEKDWKGYKECSEVFDRENKPSLKIKKEREEIKNSILKLVEKDADRDLKKIRTRKISFAPREKIITLIQEALNDPDIEIQKIAASMIKFTPKEEMTDLIKEIIENPNIDIEVKKIAVSMIWCAPKEKRTRLIEGVLMNNFVEIQKIAASMIKFTPKEEMTDLIKEIIENPNIDIEVKKIAVSMIWFTQKGEQNILFELAKEKIGDKIIGPPLYTEIDKGVQFLKRPFEKTGSRTTLLGKTLKDRLILRHITIESFLAWKKAYEDHQFWKDNGFDYVPIEPISRFKLNKKNNEVDVASGVLDLSLKDWLSMGGSFEEDLGEDISKINKLLENLGLIHGHTNLGNFCLRFFRNKDGSIDFNTKPRVYIIDFDMAKIIN